MSGKNNEDQYAISAYTLNEEKPIPVVFAIVADGIGGHNAGEIASEIAVNTISSVIEESEGTQPRQTLVEAIQQANARIAQEANQEKTRQGMGSTCVCVLVIGNRLFIASMGDSRIYLLRDGIFQQLTVDHSWVQEAINHGVISPEEAQGHPRSHIIHRYLGSNKPPNVDLRLYLSGEETPEEAQANQGARLYPHDQILLCSDGLTDLVSDEEILSNLTDVSDPEKALQRLVDLANERGGHDNITIVTLTVPERPQKKRWPAFLIPALLVAAVLIIGGIAFTFWRSNRLTAPSTSTPTVTVTVPAEEVIPSPANQDQAPLNTVTPSPTEDLDRPTYTPWPTNTTQP
jgi:protein phosphatase